jgi:hypothetical protein
MAHTMSPRRLPVAVTEPAYLAPNLIIKKSNTHISNNPSVDFFYKSSRKDTRTIPHTTEKKEIFIIGTKNA